MEKEKEEKFLRLFEVEIKQTKYGNCISGCRINGVLAHGITNVEIDDLNSPTNPARVTITFECEDIRINTTKAPLESGADVQSV